MLQNKKRNTYCIRPLKRLSYKPPVESSQSAQHNVYSENWKSSKHNKPGIAPSLPVDSPKFYV